MNTTDIYLCRRQGWPYENLGGGYSSHWGYGPVTPSWTHAMSFAIEALRRHSEKIRRYPTDVYLCRVSPKESQ